MADEILSEREVEYNIRSVTLIPGLGGVFEVEVNGEKVFSKLELKRHAEPGEAKQLVVEKMNTILKS